MRTRLFVSVFILLTLVSAPLPAQQAATAAQPQAAQPAQALTTAQPVSARTPDVLTVDTGSTGLELEFRKLRTTGRIMQVTAHPDDEDGGMLTLQARGHGVETELFTFTRGEGGQNRMGSGLFDELGVLRTLELLASDNYYGVTQRFSHCADFGFSKTPQETLQKWGGQDVPLSDLVREIRKFRPDVLIARFTGTAADGHGHHQASAMLTREAFAAAGDPTRFPEQLKQGLQPWQPRKLYMGVFGASNSTYTVEIDKSASDPVLATDYQHFAMQGLRHQLSQGAGNWNLTPGQRYTSKYNLVATSLEKTPTAAKEADFFDGIDTTLVGLASRLPNPADESKITNLRRRLQTAQGKIEAATIDAPRDREATVMSLLEARETLATLAADVAKSQASASTRSWLAQELDTKIAQIDRAAALAGGISIEAVYTGTNNAQTGALVVPGQKFRVTLRVKHDPAVQIGVSHFQLAAPSNWPVARLMASDAADAVDYDVSVPHGAEYTRPYYHRDNAEQSVYTVDEPQFAGLPFVPPPMQARLVYKVGRASGELTSNVIGEYRDTNADHQEISRVRPVAVAPVASVLIDPATRVVAASQREPVEVHVTVRSNLERLRGGMVRLRAPDGWTVQPESQPVELDGKGAEHTFKFFLVRHNDKLGAITIRAALDFNGDSLAQGFSIVSREDLGTGYYYQPATGRVSVIDVKVPDTLTVGYIMGAGDEIPTALRDAGVNVKLISPEELASGDLSKYATVVLGIRAYDVREDVRKNNARLLEYVNKGGTLVVQYNSDIQQFNSGNYAPYPLELSRDRVTMEDAPVAVLDPEDDLFDTPNTISEADFKGWVQERGLYFSSKWDEHYQPMLESHDTGEQPLKGGLLKARYGKGTYIYCGYAFFRQLPNGVPGAVRLFVNLLSAPNDEKR